MGIVFWISIIFAGVCCLIMLWIIKGAGSQIKELQKEKEELENEKKLFEEFFSVHFLKNIYPDELPNVFYQIVRQHVYLQETEIPDSFLSLLCDRSNLLKLMRDTIDLEFEKSKESDVRMKLSMLLTRLKQFDQQKNGVLRFIDAPEFLMSKEERAKTGVTFS